jgi:hypothetical protein
VDQPQYINNNNETINFVSGATDMVKVVDEYEDSLFKNNEPTGQGVYTCWHQGPGVRKVMFLVHGVHIYQAPCHHVL